MEKGSEELNNGGKRGLWNDREGKKVTVGNRNTRCLARTRFFLLKLSCDGCHHAGDCAPKRLPKCLACFRRFHKPSFQLPHALTYATLSSLDSFLVLRLINPHSVTSQLAFAMYNIMSCHHSAPLLSLPPRLPSFWLG